ncbi:hypothetical protein ACYJZK_04545 [Pediococcus pentosaceus]|uniref:hypothetical protein n=1 Tax=Pediococcus pentosaceus TaxID=1255 RepID=UPI00294EA215|nr:hypothetical protein [Pediococcus pentosaceus]MDV6379947.1 hypothetical protein [Pediococcus pentosaceus]
MIKKTNFISIIQYAFVCISILQCNTVFYRESGTNHQKVVLVLWLLVTVILWGIANGNFWKEKYNLRKLLFFELVWLVLVTSFALISYSKVPIPVTTMVMLFIPFFVVPIFIDDLNKENTILMKFRNVVLILATISLIFWILSMIGMPSTSYATIDWGRIKVIYGYFYIHYIAQGSIDFLGFQGIIRNTGIFVEAPMYSYVLSLALIVDIFLYSKLKGYSRKSLLLMITIFTTTSSTGIILVILVAFSKLMFLTKRISNGVKAIVILGLLPILEIIISYIIKSKFDSNWYSSSSIRINDFVAGYQAWKNHWILGNGLNNYNSILQNMDYRRLRLNANDGFSTGLMEVLAYGGIVYGLYFVSPIILLFRKDKKVFVVAGISFVLFTFTLVNNVFLWYIFISYFWAVLLNNKRRLEI